MNTAQRRLFEAITRWGLSARGVVFMTIGLFLCSAAWQTDPSQAQGLGGALSVLARQPFGPWLLGIVGTGPGRLRNLLPDQRRVPRHQHRLRREGRNAKQPPLSDCF